MLQRALRKQKKKQNERLVRNTLAASAAAAVKAEGDSSGSEDNLTVECVVSSAVVRHVFRLEWSRFIAASDVQLHFLFVFTHSLHGMFWTLLPFFIIPSLQIRRQCCRNQPIRPELRALEGCF
jgi:hypothetical protein